MSDLKVTNLSVETLKPYPRNARTHSKKQIKQIAASIERFGWTNPVLVDADGRIVAGHGRVAAAKSLGIEHVPTIRLENMSEAELRAYVIADNRLAENAGWDNEILAIELQTLADLDFDVELTGFEPAEIDLLIDGLDAPATDDEGDRVPNVDASAQRLTQPGDLWLLGPHRLLCGDATKAATIERLMAGEPAQMVFTDPPFNVPVGGHVSGLGAVTHREFAMASGEMSDAEFTRFLKTVLGLLAAHSADGALHFLCMDWRHVYELLTASRAVYSATKNLCVWTKNNAGMGSLYRSQHELVFVFKNGTAPHVNNVELGRHGHVSFVSVTQQFNTTSSMGRLTLNVLLSFAQFEREIAGERIRDKIAASKKKGMWMGGSVPLGYNLQDKNLNVNAAEAETIRTLFQLYLKSGSVRATAAEAERLGLTTKVRVGKQGDQKGGGPFHRGHLYTILRNPIYIGRIPHKGDSYPGMHPAIIDPNTWEAVRRKFAENRTGKDRRKNADSASLLMGLLFDTKGIRFTPSHTIKSGRRYRYYVERALITGEEPSRAKVRRIPAHEIDGFVRDAFLKLFCTPDRLLQAIGDAASAREAERAIRQGRHIHQELVAGTLDACAERIRPMLHRVVLGDGEVRIALARGPLRGALDLPSNGHQGEVHEIVVPARISTNGVGLKLVVGDVAAPKRAPDPELVRIITLAHDWWHRLQSGQTESIRELAVAERVSRAYMGRVLRLAFLAPDIVEAILEGTQPATLSTKRQLLHQNLPFRWSDQRRLLGFAQAQV